MINVVSPNITYSFIIINCQNAIEQKVTIYNNTKNTEGDKTKSDNYRGITLSPVLSKIF